MNCHLDDSSALAAKRACQPALMLTAEPSWRAASLPQWICVSSVAALHVRLILKGQTIQKPLEIGQETVSDFVTIVAADRRCMR